MVANTASLVGVVDASTNDNAARTAPSPGSTLAGSRSHHSENVRVRAAYRNRIDGAVPPP